MFGLLEDGICGVTPAEKISNDIFNGLIYLIFHFLDYFQSIVAIFASPHTSWGLAGRANDH